MKIPEQDRTLIKKFFSAALSSAAVFYIGTCKFDQNVLYLSKAGFGWFGWGLNLGITLPF